MDNFELSYYYVARKYSQTGKKILWEIVSCRIKNRYDAERWKEFMESEEPNHKFFIILK
jgi:hypothetical protein